MPDYISEPDDDSTRHSGAWKVAYADFVTALMALFIVLWLMSASPDVQKAVSSYFRSPRGQAHLTGSGVGGSGEALAVNERNVRALQGRLERALQDSPALQKLAPYVQFTVTGSGLRIELMESSSGMFFETGSPRPTAGGEKLFRMLSDQLRQLPNAVTLEGHTDAKPFHGNTPDAYGNWELSFDRANMARRIMLSYGLQANRLAEIRAYADRHPITANAMESRNRRVSIILQY